MKKFGDMTENEYKSLWEEDDEEEKPIKTHVPKVESEEGRFTDEKIKADPVLGKSFVHIRIPEAKHGEEMDWDAVARDIIKSFGL